MSINKRIKSMVISGMLKKSFIITKDFLDGNLDIDVAVDRMLLFVPTEDMNPDEVDDLKITFKCIFEFSELLKKYQDEEKAKEIDVIVSRIISANAKQFNYLKNEIRNTREDVSLMMGYLVDEVSESAPEGCTPKVEEINILKPQPSNVVKEPTLSKTDRNNILREMGFNV